jgi:hypothetical protein
MRRDSQAGQITVESEMAADRGQLYREDSRREKDRPVKVNPGFFDCQFSHIPKTSSMQG